MDVTVNCILCEKLLSTRPTCIIKEKSIKNCILASFRRQDKKHVELKKFKSLEVHEYCSKNYVSEKKIESYLKNQKSTEITGKTRRSNQLDFPFLNLCLICEEDASEEFIDLQKRKSTDKRDIVVIINNDKMKETLLSHCNESCTERSIKIYNRLLSVHDLTAVGARYHKRCFKVFCKKGSVSDTVDDSLALKASKYIASYIRLKMDP